MGEELPNTSNKSLVYNISYLHYDLLLVYDLASKDFLLTRLGFLAPTCAEELQIPPKRL